MPRFLVMQPDGLLAEFSTVVDDFTAYDMDFSEAIEQCMSGSGGRGRDDAASALKRAIEDVDTRNYSRPAAENPSHGKLGRWHQCLQTILLMHGWQACFDRMRDIGKAGAK